MIIKSIFNLIFPPKCVSCEKQTKQDTAICETCFSGISLNQTLFCGECRARLPEGKKICHKDTPYVLGAAAQYEDGAVKALVHALKFRYIKDAGSALGELITTYAASVETILKNVETEKENVIVIPIPLSKKRLRSRGFNQSEIIARVFAKKYGLTLKTDYLMRTKDTKPQSETRGRAERLENIRGCFAVQNESLFSTKDTIILIDDVITSGETVRAAAEELKGAGAKRIIALVASKA